VVCHSCEPCIVAEPIEVPFVLWTRVDPRNRVLDEVCIVIVVCVV